MRFALGLLLAVSACSPDAHEAPPDGAGGASVEAGSAGVGGSAGGRGGGGGVVAAGGRASAGGGAHASGGATQEADSGVDSGMAGGGAQADSGAVDAGDGGRRCPEFVAPDGGDAGAAEWVPAEERCDQELAAVFYPYHSVTSDPGPVRLCLVAGAERVCSPYAEAAEEFSVPATDADGLRAAFESHATVLDIVFEYPGGSVKDNGFVALRRGAEVTRYVFRLTTVEPGAGWVGLSGSVSVRGAY